MPTYRKQVDQPWPDQLDRGRGHCIQYGFSLAEGSSSVLKTMKKA